ncbi:MAG: NAD(P)-dependent oxidoreductase [Parcubacteria group bacterium]|jgi:GDP-L-fucose synthase
MKVFLTGGNGFIGKNIIEQLGDKYEILSPVRQELNLLDSCAVFEYLKINKPEIVLHVAAAGANRKDNLKPNILKNNLIIFYNLLAAKEYFNRMIVFGSGAEYDKRNNLHLVGEKDFGRSIPEDEYGLAKFTMAKLAVNLDFITHLRFFGVFGEHEDFQTRFISNSICKVLFDLPITMNQNVYFDYIYVKDAVNIIDRFIENKSRDIFYNVGSGKQIDLLTIAKIILDITKKDLPIKIAKRGLNNEYTCDISKLKNEFSELEFIDVKNAITEMVEYYKTILPSLNKKSFI